MNNIEKHIKIKKETLSSEFYFQTLLEQSYKFSLFSDLDLEKIQFDCLSLLAKKTKQYNSGDSSSVRIEVAQTILDSIMFTIGVALKNYPTPDDAIIAIQSDSAEALLQKGREHIKKMVNQSKNLHSDIANNLFQTQNVFYSSTIVDGIKGFFKLYYPEFAAHEIHITADYPVHCPAKQLLGIEFIQNYLNCIYYENKFCNKFSAKDVHHLLCGYSEGYEDLLLNIYEPVLSAAIGCILSGKDALKLNLTPSSNQMLYSLFLEKSRIQIEKILLSATDQLGNILDLSESERKYVILSLPKIAMAIENSIELQTIDVVFLIPKYPEIKSKLIVSFGEKMGDKKYRKVLKEVMQCPYLENKKAIIKSEIHSLADLEDILLDGELNEEEILDILGDLNPTEIASLVKKHPFPSEIDKYGMAENKIILCQCLEKFITTFPIEQQKLLKSMVDIIDIM